MIDTYINSVKEFYQELSETENGRYLSWEHCYLCFMDARKQKKPDIDYLCLMLSFYLASWGMYRGSSFLLQRDYKIHETVVKIIIDKKYDSLAGIKCSDYHKNENKELLEELYNKINKYYHGIRKQVREEFLKNSDAEPVKNDVSYTLITKILLGTLGCVPAYDRYFIAGVKKEKVTTGIYGNKSIDKLVSFYETHNKDFEKLRKTILTKNDGKHCPTEYPQMKILDMMFWKIGINKEIEESKKK